ncbi:MAG: acyl-CoA thioesterase [Acidobacteria bacterium]|nr:acyl-CoA thioesterase [Acidobacteriota bacterium]
MTRMDMTMPPDGWFSVRFRVRFAETDAAGIVHHSVYLVWFEEGRSEFSRQLGMPYSGLEQAGVELLLTRSEVRYLKAIRYDEEIEIRTRTSMVKSRRMVFEYQAARVADGVVAATGTTEHLAVSRTSGRPVRIPEPFFSSWKRAVVASST